MSLLGGNFNPNRVKLLKVFKALNELKRNHEVFSTTDFNYDLAGTGKRIRLNHSDENAVIIGNFGVEDIMLNPGFQHTGTWYDFFSGDSIHVSDVNDPFYLNPGEFHILSNFYIDPPEENLLSTHREEFFLPNTIEINQNYPNPFNPSTFIEVSSNENRQIRLEIFDIIGELIDTLMDEYFTSGIRTIQWNASFLPSGIYIARISSGSINKSVKMLLVK